MSIKSPDSFIFLYHETGRKRSSICKEKYEDIRDFIVSKLKQRGILTVSELLDLCFTENNFLDRNSFSKLIFQVKKDMEIRGFIKVSFDSERNQFITLVKKKLRLPILQNEKQPKRIRKF